MKLILSICAAVFTIFALLAYNSALRPCHPSYALPYPNVRASEWRTSLQGWPLPIKKHVQYLPRPDGPKATLSTVDDENRLSLYINFVAFSVLTLSTFSVVQQFRFPKSLLALWSTLLVVMPAIVGIEYLSWQDWALFPISFSLAAFVFCAQSCGGAAARKLRRKKISTVDAPGHSPF